ncbi:MAG TPA: exodeoxyribonuclease III [Gammaproteobacteria bacterium]|nr:exodeoxyribonuclease III [Gammaproteobacteria bacterium]
MQLASWNVNSINVRLPQVLAYLEEGSLDLLALQETKVPDGRFPREAFAEAGWQVLASGQNSYNGVAILSREPAREVVLELPEFADPQRRVLAASFGELRLINLYVPNGQAVDSPKYAYKLAWLAALERFLQTELATHGALAVVGDFNIAPAPADVHDPAAWEGRVLFSEPERAALGRLLDLGLVDSFRLFSQPAGSFSWWDYRLNSFRRGRGLRIDLALLSRSLAARCRASSIDADWRAQERPSDHAPVRVELADA